MRRFLLAAVVATATLIPLSGLRSDTPLTNAALAWDRGDYVSALTTYLEILDSNEADAALETIALQTGELFHTTELTTDGDAPKFSPDGRHVLYETGELVGRVTRVHATADPARVATELPGIRAAFSGDGSRVAYLRLDGSPALKEAAAAVDAGPPAGRGARLTAYNALLATESRLVVRDLASGQETPVRTGNLRKGSLAFAGAEILLAASADSGDPQIYVVRTDAEPAPITTGPGDKALGEVSPAGTAFTFTARAGGPGRGGAAPGGGRGAGAAGPRFSLVTLPDGRVTNLTGSAPTFSRDGSRLAWIGREGDDYRLMAAPVANASSPAVVRSGPERIDAPAFSPDGSRLAFQMMTREDWEIHTIGADGKDETRVTREIQHDLMPKYLGPDRLLAMMGEARHRRSHIYDLSTGKRLRLFHNNTVRTIAPEYAWIPSHDGSRVLIVAERDGDTVSPERGVYLVDLTRKVTKEELRARVRANLAAEQELRARTQALFAPIAADVRKVVAEASVPRVFSYEEALFRFDSKHVTQPGNRRAAQYLLDTYRSFGYEPELQEFELTGRNAGIRTANVLATLKGTVNPELVYVVSSHYDSVATGPGADDDSSGTAALLEAARILARHPQPATIVFASFTGEEAGLLGSREYVRQAVEKKIRIVGALNNDMIGWANDHRLDNTIRYSNPGIRDIQHGAAMHFTNLITYDALYYKSTDAAAYYEAFGDIVGGIGSYPVLGNPHYHQPHDVLETINHQLVTEVAKTTAATLMLLASSPSRLADLKVDSFENGTARISWTPAAEKGVAEYIVAYGPAGKPLAQQTRVKTASTTLQKVAPGTVISVKAVNARGMEGWDWARVTVGK